MRLPGGGSVFAPTGFAEIAQPKSASTLANGLRVLMPPQPGQEALTLYRGTSLRERTRRVYGFSWTKDREIARVFAAPWTEGAKQLGAVLVVLPLRMFPLDSFFESHRSRARIDRQNAFPHGRHRRCRRFEDGGAKSVGCALNHRSWRLAEVSEFRA